MPRYRASELASYLQSQGFTFEGLTRDGHGMGFYAPDGHPFTFPAPDNGFFDSDIVDLILADRWIPIGQLPLPKYPD